MNVYYLKQGKEIIEKSDVHEFRELIGHYVETIKEKEYRFDYLFKDLFIHACLRGNLEIVKELYSYYKDFSDIDKIGLKPTFLYCKYITKDKSVLEFLKNLRKF